ncbi:serine/threonine-protein kinase, partial [Singulisphaera rosea]
EVSPGRRLDLDLRNVVVSTGGSLVHAHGQPRGQVAQPLKLTLNQVTARTAGGLVQLESAQDEPDLPVADVSAHDSILATTSQGAPLFRVDGQDTLTSLSDRIRWEGHGVAYHEINAYRRDQSAQPGTVPKIYDQPSWMVAIGTKEAAPVHGNLKFLKEWEPGRMPWTLGRDDVQLTPDSPAARAGADLKRIPVAPSRPG